MRRSHTASFPQAGFTLVELVLAVGIALLVTAVLFAAYHVVVRTAEQQGLRGKTATEGFTALDQLSRDLACTLHVPDVPALGFVMGIPEDAPDPGIHVLAFTTAVPPPDDPDLRWFTAEQVTYLTRAGSLLRIARPLPSERGLPATTNVAATRVRSFVPQAWASGAWTNTWVKQEKSSPLPPAVRVRVVLSTSPGGPDQTYETEVYIPLGNTFTSRITRAGASE